MVVYMIGASGSFTELCHQACDVDCRQSVLSLLEKNCEARFLDCGCGNGDVTLKMLNGVTYD